MAVTYASNIFTVTPNTSTAGTGTITATATTVIINGVTYTATQVTGVGTSFTTQLVRGSLLSLPGFTDMIVYSIATNTSLVALKQDYTTNAQVIGTATAFTFRAPTFWTDLVASVTATALPAVASTDGRLNIAFTTSSVTIQANAVLICADNVNMSFGNASGYRMNIASAGSLIMRNGGRITYNGNVGYAFFAGTVDCWNGRFVYQANQTVASGRQDFFDPTTMNSHFISAMDVVFSGGTSGCSTFIHLERLGGKVSELKMFNQMALAGSLVLIQFDAGTYPNVTFPSATSSLGFAPNLGVYLARSGGTSTLVKPTFPGSSYSISNPGISGNAYIIDEIWPDNSGAVGTLTYPSGTTTIYRQFTWYPGTYFTEGGWNVYLRDNQGTPVVVQSGVVTANTGLLMTWRKTTGTITNYYPFKITARKAGYIGKYETFTPIAPRTENFLPVVDATYTSDQSGLSGISANNSTNTITSSSNMTLDQRYDWFQYWMALTPQMIAYGSVARVDSVNGTEWILPTGWTDLVTAGTLSNGSKLNYEYSPTFTVSGTGKITAIYASTLGTSTVLTISGFGANSAVYVEDDAGVQQYFNADVTGSVVVYIPPTATGSWYYAVEKFGNQRQSDFFTFSGGQKAIVVKELPDSKILLTEAEITALPSNDHPDEAYDAIALLRTGLPYISFGQIVSKDGATLYGYDYDIVIDANAVKVAEVDYDNKLITLKSALFEAGPVCNLVKVDVPKTVTANASEVITVNIEDGNGDSTVTTEGTVGSLMDVWKCVEGTINADYATGTKIGSNLPAGKFRFIGETGFKLIFYDKNFLLARDCSMAKGIYELGWYVYDKQGGGFTQTQAAKFETIYSKVDVIDDNVVSVKDTVENLSASSGATLAEIEASDILAKEATSQSIKTTVEDKTGYALTTAQVEAIAVAVEAHLLDEGDTQKLIEAIVNAIGNANVDEIALIAAIRSDLERTGGKLDAIETTVDDLENYNDALLTAKVDAVKDVVDSIKEKTDVLENTNLTGIATANDIGEAVDSINYQVSKVNDTVRSIKDKTDLLENYNDETLVSKVDAIPTTPVLADDSRLNHLDANISSRSTLKAEDIPEGLTIEDLENSTVISNEPVLDKLSQMDEGLKLIANFEPYE